MAEVTTSAPMPTEKEIPDVAGVCTELKLQNAIDGFPPFDDAMKKQTRIRMENDRRKVEAMRVEMQRLEDALEIQTSKRVSMNEEIQKHCDVVLEKAYQHFDSLLKHQKQAVHDRLDTLEQRIADLDELFAREKARIMHEIEEEALRLSKMLDEFQEAFEEEVRQRLAREEVIKAQMAAHEADVAEKFAEEKVAREAVIAELQKIVAEHIVSRQAADKAFRIFGERELVKLQDRLTEECERREVQDDEIVAALNKYASRLQTSLRIINSTDA